MLAGKAKPVRNYMGAILAEPQANVIDVQNNRMLPRKALKYYLCQPCAAF